VLVLDAGHHPYNSRYLFQTLRCVSRSAGELVDQPAVTVLSSWRYAGAHSRVSWSTPEERSTWKTVLKTQAGDALDIINIDFAQNA
jgi:hypothetical protein